MFFFVRSRAAPFDCVYNKQSSKCNFNREPLRVRIKQQAPLTPHVHGMYGSRVVTRAARYYLVMPVSPAKITCLESWFTWSEPKWLIVCRKHWNVVGVIFYVGFPVWAHRAHVCFDLGGRLSGWDPPPSYSKARHVFYFFMPLLLLPECNDQLKQTHNSVCSVCTKGPGKRTHG